VYPRMLARHAETAERVHCKRKFGRRANRVFPHVSIRGLEVRIGGS